MTSLTGAVGIGLRISGRREMVGEGVRVSRTGDRTGAVLDSLPDGFQPSVVAGGMSIGGRFAMGSAAVLVLGFGEVPGSFERNEPDETIVGPTFDGGIRWEVETMTGHSIPCSPAHYFENERKPHLQTEELFR